MNYSLTAEGIHGWEMKFKPRVKEADLANEMAKLMARGGVLRVVVRQADAERKTQTSG